MTKQKSFKKQVRARADKTGESYSTAKRQLIAKSETETRKRRTPKTISPNRTSDAAVRENTGKPWKQWFALLDAWGAKQKKHPQIARWLSEEHGVDGWWAQNITVTYEQERGMRAPGQMADGSYSVSASRTINVPVDRLYRAFHEEGERNKWLGGGGFAVRTARPSKSITANWSDSTRLSIGFTSKGETKSQVALAHEKLTDATQADELKAYWKERLEELRSLLET